MTNSKIVAFSSYLPKKIVKNEELSEFLDTSDEWIYSRTGIKERRISLAENTSDMSTIVANKLLEKSKLKASEIDLIIIATVTGDYSTPSTSCIVHNNIKAKNAIAFDISAGCSGFIYALSIADKYIKSNMVKNAIVIGSECLSKITNWKDRSSAVLFGDGSAGVLIEASTNKKSIITESLHSDGELMNAITAGYTPVKNYFNDVEDNFDKHLFMNGREVFTFVSRNIPDDIKYILEKSKLSLDEIKYIVPHQANARIIDILAKKLKINKDKFYLNIDKYANTSSASVPIAINEMLEKGLISYGNNEKILLTAFGAGVTWGSMILEI